MCRFFATLCHFSDSIFTISLAPACDIRGGLARYGERDCLRQGPKSRKSEENIVIDPISWSFSGPYIAAALACGYLLGSIPFGLLLTRFAGLGDIRGIGSGNIGATNVLRTGRKSLAGATLLFDAGKGALAVWLGNY